MIKFLVIILALIGIWMIILGYRTDMLPPLLTGVGFIIIVVILLFGHKEHDQR